MGADAIVSIVSAALGIVSAAAPGVLAAATGHQTDDEAIAAMSDAAKKLRVREDGGEWDADLERRRKGDS